MKRLGRSDSQASDAKLERASSALLPTLTVCILLLGVQVAHAGKPAPPPPPPPAPSPPPAATDLPNIGYVLTWLPITARDINNVGDVAGTASGAAYAISISMDGETATTTNLNDLGAIWYDLNAATPNTVSTGWTASTADGINDAGDIVGTATKKRSKSRVYVLENAFNRDYRPRRFLLLPTRSNVDYLAPEINNWGMVVANEWDSDKGVIRYTPKNDASWPYYAADLAIPGTGSSLTDINDYGVIVDRYTGGSAASSWRLIPGAGVNGTDKIEFFDGFELMSISNNFISGRSAIENAAGPIRLPALGSTNDVQLIWLNNSRSWAVSDRGDTTFTNVVDGVLRGYLYSDAINPVTGKRYGTEVDGIFNGILPLDQLILNSDAYWRSSHTEFYGINDLDVSGFGQLWGAAWPTNDPSYTQGFVLTPIALP